jgi:hypothetical protein
MRRLLPVLLLAIDPANVTVTVLNPPAVPGTDQNEAPVVLRPVFGGQSFLLAGDAGTTAEGWMLASGLPLASTVLTVGHHGSDTAGARARDRCRAPGRSGPHPEPPCPVSGSRQFDWL